MGFFDEPAPQDLFSLGSTNPAVGRKNARTGNAKYEAVHSGSDNMDKVNLGNLAKETEMSAATHVIQAKALKEDLLQQQPWVEGRIHADSRPLVENVNAMREPVHAANKYVASRSEASQQLVDWAKSAAEQAAQAHLALQSPPQDAKAHVHESELPGTMPRAKAARLLAVLYVHALFSLLDLPGYADHCWMNRKAVLQGEDGEAPCAIVYKDSTGRVSGHEGRLCYVIVQASDIDKKSTEYPMTDSELFLSKELVRDGNGPLMNDDLPKELEDAEVIVVRVANALSGTPKVQQVVCNFHWEVLFGKQQVQTPGDNTANAQQQQQQQQQEQEQQQQQQL